MNKHAIARKLDFSTASLSLRISLKVVIAIAQLMMAALMFMSYHARKALKEEAVKKAEETLDIVVRKTDNVLLCIEQASGNIYFELLRHLDQPEELRHYCEEVVKSSPYIEGCAVAFDPDYREFEKGHSMIFFHRTSAEEQLAAGAPPVIEEDPASLVPHKPQGWYATVMETGRGGWSVPFKDEDDHDKSVITYGLPIYDFELKRPVGVFALGVSLQLLSDVVLQDKPSNNSYAVLIDNEGYYIVHPDSNILHHQDVNTRVTRRGIDTSVKKAAQAVMSGEKGYKEFNLYGQDNYVFYKPFQRISTPMRDTSDLGWSVGLVYPKQDVFEGLLNLQLYTILIVIAVLLLVLQLCYVYLRRQLRPLRMLTASAQRIAKGHFDETVPETQQLNEVGQLQNHFQQLQVTLAKHTDRLNQQIAQLNEQGEHLAAAYEHSKEADRMKTAFLHNMSDQMIPPVESMSKDVADLCQRDDTLTPQQVEEKVNNIQQQGKQVTKLLNDLLTSSL